ncbi:MAG: uracil-DNA glycosylase [Clostridia bacterium]|nr:uracil-DNA glycosylase [Clostridia bacterium]
MVHLGNSWDSLLEEEFKKPYYQKLRQFLVQEYNNHTVYPDMSDIYTALKTTDYHSVKVVIIGQDPYHGPNQAHGLSFSVKPGIEPPPSLKNIFQEINKELDIPIPKTGCLLPWAKQGVLLLNAVLTVRAGEPNSHKGMGWETLTDRIIELLNQRNQPMVFLLWGATARKKAEIITNPNHLILSCAHPSPLSAYNGFFGCGHFKACNKFLASQGLKPIDWHLD